MLTASIQDDAAVVYAIRLQTYLNIMGISVLLFDHFFVTLGAEISLIWTKPKAASAYWFFFNRYIAFFGNIAVFAFGFDTLPPQVCEPYNSFRQALLVISQGLICVLLLIRTYALYGLSVRLLIFLLVVGALLLGVAVWALTTQDNSTETQVAGCYIDISMKTGFHLAVVWEALFVYDTIIFILTVVRTYKRRPRELLTISPTEVAPLFFRDGSFYFAAMAIVNLANILTFYMAGPLLKGGLSGFASSVSVTMMSRLILNLHAITAKGILTENFTELNFTAHMSAMDWHVDDEGSPNPEGEEGIELQEITSSRPDNPVP